MSSVSGLSARRVRLFVQRLGGPDAAALALGLDEGLVRRWVTEGLDDGALAKRLAKLSGDKVRRPGPRPRRPIMSADEVEEAVHRHGGYTNAALTLGIAPSTLRRYARGTFTAPATVCYALRGAPMPRSRTSPWAELVREAGGRRRVAAALGVSYTTVRAWTIGLTAPSAAHRAELLHLVRPDRPA